MDSDQNPITGLFEGLVFAIVGVMEAVIVGVIEAIVMATVGWIDAIFGGSK